MDVLKDLFTLLFLFLRQGMEFLRPENLTAMHWPNFSLDEWAHSLWPPLLAFVTALLFFYKNKQAHAACVLMATATAYIMYYLVPRVPGSLSGVVVFSVATVATAGVVIYFMLIRPD